MLTRSLAAVAALCLVAPSAPAPGLDPAAALRSRVKHVFVIYQENHSFDNYFGTFPGADNLATAEAQAHGFANTIPSAPAGSHPFASPIPTPNRPRKGASSFTTR
jgi:phospholipase C